MARHKSPAIGIDLGTTNSCVGVYLDGKVKIIPNEYGNRTTPSCVAFTEDGILVGERAQKEALVCAEHLIYDTKRLIGRRFDEPDVTRDMKMWPFKVQKCDENDSPGIVRKRKYGVKLYHPQEISAQVLTKMKVVAEEATGYTIRNAVITVPAYFNDSQRNATKEAARIAGLHVLRLVNEPTAAAIAYDLDNPTVDEANVLVYDLGGGTFDVSILNIDDGCIEGKATDGDTHLGGQDIVTTMMKRLTFDFEQSVGLTIESDAEIMRRLRDKCEWAKVRLSTQEEVKLDITSLKLANDFHTTITRKQLEEWSKDLLEKTFASVDNALANAKLSAKDIKEIILIGGATKMPKVRSMIRQHFSGNTLCTSINPDEAVAYGAALLAAKLNGDIEGCLLIDVTPLSLGTDIKVEEVMGIMSTIIHRGSSVPCKNTETYFTARDDQTEIYVGVYEGERSNVNDNRLLGECTLTGIPPAPAGEESIEVTFDVDTDGIIHVSAIHEETGNNVAVDIVRDPASLTEESIKAMIKDAERHYKAEKEAQKKNKATASQQFSHDLD